MQSYSAIEQAVVGQLLTVFPDKLSPERVKAGDIDAVVDALFSEGSTHGCIIEMGPGRQGSGQTFERDAWVWTLYGYYIIRFSEAESIEQEMRAAVDRLPGLFAGNRRLDNLAVIARVVRVEAPDPTTINDIPFYWITFIVEVIVRDAE